MVKIICAIALVVMVIVYAVKYYTLKERIVTLTENSPKKSTKEIAKTMKFQDELIPYVTEEDGKLYLTVVKPKK